jgi:geranylgeranylglycerol-phosphate geranylgeranyltransferase
VGKNKVTAFTRLLRPINSVMMAFAVMIGAVTLQKSVFPITPLLLGFVTAFTLNGASMVTNDYWDRSVDAINEPTRPIPSGQVSTGEALIYASILITIGLASAYLTNLACLFVAAISILVSLTYNTKGKQMGLLGNFMVSTCVAIPFIYGGLIYGGVDFSQRGFVLALFFALMAFLSNTGREVTKGIADVEGDKTRNVRTLAIKHGSRTAASISVLFYLLAIILSVFVWLFGFVSWWYLPLVILADAGFIWSSLTLLQDHSKENAKKVKRRVLAWMLIGLLAFIVGGI